MFEKYEKFTNFIIFRFHKKRRESVKNKIAAPFSEAVKKYKEKRKLLLSDRDESILQLYFSNLYV